MNKTKFKKLYISDLVELSTIDLCLYNTQEYVQVLYNNTKSMFDVDQSIRCVATAWLRVMISPLVFVTIYPIMLMFSRDQYKKSADKVLKDGRHTFQGSWHHTNETVWWVSPEKFTRSWEEMKEMDNNE